MNPAQFREKVSISRGGPTVADTNPLWPNADAGIVDLF
jgi:hypothetical protein